MMSSIGRRLIVMRSFADASMPNMTNNVIYLSQRELAARWGISPRTLENWRWRNKGPTYIKLGRRRVRYRLTDIQAFERDHRIAPESPRENTP
jgi:predicted DNA-binding transcriptional regulator AlpA